MALTLVDAGVVIALLDPDDEHQGAARNCFVEHESDRLLLPASAYAEALGAPARVGRTDEVRARIAELIEVLPLDAETAEVAAGLRATHPALRLPDALVLATAEVTQADVVLTTDRRWQRFARVRVIP